MIKTALTHLKDFIDGSVSVDDILEKIEELTLVEEWQIEEAFNEGETYGKGETTFDYPAQRYFNYTYKNTEDE